MPVEKQSHERPRCGVVFKGRPPCKQYAGHGTDHVGTGACSRHGGATTGAPQGNKNALTTGRYETIFADALDEDELALMERAANQSAIAHLEEEVALATVRERRMLLRIAALKGVAMTVVEETTETIASGDDGPNIPDRIASELSSEDLDELTDGLGDGKTILKRRQKQAGTLGQIQAIESDLTAIQAFKAKTAAKLHELKNPASGKLKVELTGADGAPVEVSHGLPDAKRAASLAALLDRVRTRTAGQPPGADG